MACGYDNFLYIVTSFFTIRKIKVPPMTYADILISSIEKDLKALKAEVAKQQKHDSEINGEEDESFEKMNERFNSLIGKA